MKKIGESTPYILVGVLGTLVSLLTGLEESVRKLGALFPYLEPFIKPLLIGATAMVSTAILVWIVQRWTQWIRTRRIIQLQDILVDAEWLFRYSERDPSFYTPHAEDDARANIVCEKLVNEGLLQPPENLSFNRKELNSKLGRSIALMKINGLDATKTTLREN